jgi:hypothetical protein
MTVLWFCSGFLIGLGVVIPEPIGLATKLSSNKKGPTDVHKGPWDNRPGPLLLVNHCWH